MRHISAYCFEGSRNKKIISEVRRRRYTCWIYGMIFHDQTRRFFDNAQDKIDFRIKNENCRGDCVLENLLRLNLRSLRFTRDPRAKNSLDLKV